MGDSLAFHLLFIIFGVALPLLISGTELYGIIRHRPKARALARTWSKALVILFVVGAVSGTVISLQFNLFWPRFLEFINKPVGLAFALEGTFFMIEAVFLSIYMLSWDRFKPIYHWLCSIPMVIGSMGSAVFITTVNAFMNQPRGFLLGQDGNPIQSNTFEAMFNPATYTTVVHSILGYITACAFVFLSIYIWLYLKEKHKADRPWFRQVIVALAMVGLLFGILTAIVGDQSGKYLAKHEPYKLAAAEGLMETQRNAPLTIGGIVKDGEIKYGIKIPSLLSFLAANNFGAEVKGLNEFPEDERPSLVVHYFFDGMVLCGILIVLIPGLFLSLLALKKRRAAFSKPMLLALMACGVLAVFATMFGWLLTELGRQPYIVHGYLKVADALTTNQAVIKFGFIFPVFFLTLLILCVVILRKTMNHQAVRDVDA